LRDFDDAILILVRNMLLAAGDEGVTMEQMVVEKYQAAWRVLASRANTARRFNVGCTAIFSHAVQK
jgi:hypothetical protein